MYTDSHCHITCDELYENLDEVLSHMEDISRFMVICTNRTEFERARKMDDPRMKVAFGFYPGDVDDVTEGDLEFLESQLKEGKVDVLGEIGLDYHWTTDNKEAQKALFVRQMELANQYGVPIAIHMRDASKNTLDLLKAHAKTPIIFHCYSGSPETMQEALKLNSLISFAGPITYKNARSGPACVQACPVERMLTETDSPYLAPVPMRGKRNEPAFVCHTAKKICDLKGLDEKAFCSQIQKNFDSLFMPE